MRQGKTVLMAGVAALSAVLIARVALLDNAVVEDDRSPLAGALTCNKDLLPADLMVGDRQKVGETSYGLSQTVESGVQASVILEVELNEWMALPAIIVHSASLKGHSDVIVQLEDKSLEVAVPEGGQGSFELSTASYVAQPLEGDLITGVTLCLDVDSVQVNA